MATMPMMAPARARPSPCSAPPDSWIRLREMKPIGMAAMVPKMPMHSSSSTTPTMADTSAPMASGSVLGRTGHRRVVVAAGGIGTAGIRGAGIRRAGIGARCT